MIQIIGFIFSGLIALFFFLKWVANPKGNKLYPTAFFINGGLSIMNLLLFITQ